MSSSVPERCTEQDTLASLPALVSALHGCKVIVSDGLEMKILGGKEAQGEESKGCAAGIGRKYKDQGKS